MADETNGNPTDEDPSESDSTEVKSSIVMRIDAPEAEAPVDEEDHNEAVVSPSFSPASRSFPPHKPSSSSFGSLAQFYQSTSSNNHGSYSSKSGGSSGGSPGPKPLLLRPSQLAVASNEVTNSDSAEQRIGSTTQEADGAEPSATPDPAPDQVESSSTPAAPAPAMMFVPLGAALHHKDDNCTVGNSHVSSSASSFVFGQNLHARAASSAGTMEAPDSTSGRPQPLPGTSQVTSNGTNASEMLFTSVIQCDPVNADSSATGSNEVERSCKSLSEAAAEYEESRANKRKYEEVAVFTGEEDEVNVVQVNCRLFAFDNTSGAWVERGRGTLRLNDKEAEGGVQSRVVMRTTGSLRVVLNTKIWGGMSVDRPSQKSVRLTAMESTGQIKVFLVMASPKEIDSLFKLLQSRVARRLATEASDQPTAFQNKRREVQDAGGGSDPGGPPVDP